MLGSGEPTETGALTDPSGAPEASMTPSHPFTTPNDIPGAQTSMHIMHFNHIAIYIYFEELKKKKSQKGVRFNYPDSVGREPIPKHGD